MSNTLVLNDSRSAPLGGEDQQGRQFTHDITLIDEGAEVEMISRAVVLERVRAGRHICLSETYLRPGARPQSVSIGCCQTNAKLSQIGGSA